MRYLVSIPQWIEGKPLHILVEVQDKEDAINKALLSVSGLFTAYGQEMPEEAIRRVITVKQVS